jgi:hypothetical protein
MALLDRFLLRLIEVLSLILLVRSLKRLKALQQKRTVRV